MKDGGVEIADMNWVLDGFEAQFIGGSDELTAADSGPGEPHGEPVPIVVATGFADALAGGGPTEFAAPHEEGFIPETGAFEIRDESRDGFVRLAGVQSVVGDAIVVTVPSVLDVSAAAVELDEAHAFLEKPPGDETFATEIGGEFVVESVGFAGGCAFVVEIHHLGSGGLHAVGEFVGLDACGEFALARSGGQVGLVEFLEKVESMALRTVADAAWGREVQQRRTDASEQGALVGGGHVTGRPIRGAADGASAGIGHDHEAGKILVQGTQSIIQPSAEAGFADEDAAAVHLETSARMGGGVGMHGADDAQIIGELRSVGEQAADLESAAAVMTELERRLHEFADGATVGADLGIAAVGLAIPLGECGFRIEGVDLTRPAIHEEEHAVFGFGGKVRGFDREWIQHLGRVGGGSGLGACEESVAGQLIDQGESGETAADKIKQWGWYAPDWKNPTQPWRFVAVTEKAEFNHYYHGEGIGDVNGDGRHDLVLNEGWWEQPAPGAPAGTLWKKHPFVFSTDRGGAQILVFDVNGDGRNDVVTAKNAHGWGLSWFEQTRAADGTISFSEHRMMGSREEEAVFGVAFSQPHALASADLDGDGLPDVITGKRRWAHGPKGDVEPMATPVNYAFLLRRDPKAPGGAKFVPTLIDDASGLGTQVVAEDVDGDGAPDVLAASKLGAFVFRTLRSAR